MGADLNAGGAVLRRAAEAEDAAKIKAPINAQYGELDTRITGGWPAYDAALTAAQVPHEGHIYKGANHGFHNDTTRATTKPRPSRRGSARSTGSTSTCVERLRFGRRLLRSPFARTGHDLSLPEPVKGTILAPKPRESGECRF